MPHYREFAAPAPLRALVECGWRGAVEPGAPPYSKRVLPDGCMDVIWGDGQLIVAGPDTAAFTAVQLPGQSSFGLRFRPGAAPSVLGVPASELRDRRVPLVDVHPGLARRVGSLLAEGVALPDALTSAITDALPAAPAPDPALGRAAGLLAGGAGVAATADALGWTSCSLRRHAHAAFGYGPATLRRVLRFRRACGLAWRGVPAAEVAVRAGYADQAHLSREVRALAGVPLGQLTGDGASGANRSSGVPSGSRTSA